MRPSGFSKPRKPMKRQRKPMARAGRTASGKPRARLRAISKTRDPAAEVFYRAEVASITDRIGEGRCENPFDSRLGFAAGEAQTHHCLKRSAYGRKRRAERDARAALLRLCASCHGWVDEARAGRRGRLVTTPLGGERYEIVLLERDHEQRVLYTRPPMATPRVVVHEAERIPLPGEPWP